MKITKIEPFILHVPIAQKQISDANNSISHWGIVGAKISTDSGIIGYGYTATHAEVTGDRAIATIISQALAPQRLQDARRVRRRRQIVS